MVTSTRKAPTTGSEVVTAAQKAEPRTLATARSYTDMGLSVIPVHSVKADGSCTCGDPGCKNPGKHPIGAWKSLTLTRLSDREITMHWNRNPDCNIGIITGPVSCIIVIDIDGDIGLESLQTQLGMTLDEMPMTPMVRTPGGGFHLYYRYIPDTRIKTRAGVLPGVDIRAEGGLVVAPPSKHHNGGTYQWVEGRSIYDVPVAEFDFSKLYPKSSDAANKKKTAEPKPRHQKLWFMEALKGVPDGTRNDTATRLTGRYAHMGLIQMEAEMLLGKWNESNSPPLEDKELVAVIGSIYNKEHPEQKLDRQGLLDSISSIMGITLKDVRKIRSDDSTSTRVEMVFDRGICCMSNNDLLNPANFQREIAAATSHVVKKLSQKAIVTHEKLVQMILDAAEVVSIGECATDIGEALDYVRRYIRISRIQPEILDPKDATNRVVFRYEGHLWFDVHILMAQMAASRRSRWTVKNFAVLLERIGLPKRDFNGNEFFGISYEMAGYKPNTEAVEGDGYVRHLYYDQV